MPNICLLCKANEENLGHLFFKCGFSRHVWSEVIKILGPDWQERTWEEWIAWVEVKFQGKSLQARVGRLVFYIVVYLIWKERKSRMHDGGDSTSTRVIQEVIFLVTYCTSFLRNVKNNVISRRLQLEWGFNRSIFDVD